MFQHRELENCLAFGPLLRGGWKQVRDLAGWGG